MIRVSRPGPAAIQARLNAQGSEPFSYAPVGASRDIVRAPDGFVLDHGRTRLGFGRPTFERAKAAVRGWEMFNLGWLELCWPKAEITAGTTVGVLLRLFGVWSLNACRIVYVTEENGETERFGFAYGTLPDHVESGEERFWVELDHRDDSVWYDLLAFSRPNRLTVRLGFFYARILQRRFAADSYRAMARAAARPSTS